MNRIKEKPKALKEKTKNVFFRALFFGLMVCVVTRICLSLVFALVISMMSDGNWLIDIFAPITAVLSLFAGGFAVGKTHDTNLSAFVLGCICLLITYLIASVFDVTCNLDAYFKTVAIALTLICPVLGAVISRKKSRQRRRYNRRM